MDDGDQKAGEARGQAEAEGEVSEAPGQKVGGFEATPLVAPLLCGRVLVITLGPVSPIRLADRRDARLRRKDDRRGRQQQGQHIQGVNPHPMRLLSADRIHMVPLVVWST